MIALSRLSTARLINRSIAESLLVTQSRVTDSLLVRLIDPSPLSLGFGTPWSLLEFELVWPHFPPFFVSC